MKLPPRIETKAVLVAGTVILFVALSLQFSIRPSASDSAYKATALSKLTVSGWDAKDLDIGGLELSEDKVRSILQFDDYQFREFTHGVIKVAVYIAHWRKGRVAVQEVAQHTPDVCWVSHGWEIVSNQHNVELALGELRLSGVEIRTYWNPSVKQTQYVWFWHLANGEITEGSQRNESVSGAMRWYIRVVTQALRPAPEQYLVRISSPVPLEQLVARKDIRAMLESLPQIRSGAE